MNTPLAELREVSKVYRSAGRDGAGVRNISMKIFEGELVLLLGPSGSGKTTLLTLMAGLLAPSGGVVMVEGRDLSRCSPAELQRLRASRIGVVFQAFNLIDSLTVAENLQIALRFGGMNSPGASMKARSLLAEFGIGHLARERPGCLSHGEKQRLSVARAVANEPALILADEPTASLDSDNGFRVFRLLRYYARERGRGVVVATHDNRLRECADRVLSLRDGELCGSGVEIAEELVKP